MTNISDVHNELSEEVSIILAKDFAIAATTTRVVPHSGDSAITFPNLDEKKQSCKIIDTCVLYIDIRRSTEMSISLKPETVAKLYSAFVRAMTRCARYYGGYVRGIIGDRVMVIFDCDDCFASAVYCAILMNSTAKYVINKHFTRKEVQCGIGIDAGKMLVTKTGFRRRGIEQHNYKNLVWLGRPANVASKLTDIANKSSEVLNLDVMEVAYSHNLFSGLQWIKEYPLNFVRNLIVNNGKLYHKNPNYVTHIFAQEEFITREETKPILMTQAVYGGFKRDRPDDQSIKGDWFKKVNVEVPGYSGTIFGGDVHFKIFNK